MIALRRARASGACPATCRGARDLRATSRSWRRGDGHGDRHVVDDGLRRRSAGRASAIDRRRLDDAGGRCGSSSGVLERRSAIGAPAMRSAPTGTGPGPATDRRRRPTRPSPAHGSHPRRRPVASGRRSRSSALRPQRAAVARRFGGRRSTASASARRLRCRPGAGRRLVGASVGAASGASAVGSGGSASARRRVSSDRRLGRRRSARRVPGPGSRWATASNSRIEPATAALSEPTAPRIGIRTTKSQRRRTGRAEALALAADDDRERAAEVGLAGGQRRLGLGADDAQAADCGGR